MTFRVGDYIVSASGYPDWGVGKIVDIQESEMTVYIRWEIGGLSGRRVHEIRHWNGVVAVLKLLD